MDMLHNNSGELLTRILCIFTRTHTRIHINKHYVSDKKE